MVRSTKPRHIHTNRFVLIRRTRPWPSNLANISHQNHNPPISCTSWNQDFSKAGWRQRTAYSVQHTAFSLQGGLILAGVPFGAPVLYCSCQDSRRVKRREICMVEIRGRFERWIKRGSFNICRTRPSLWFNLDTSPVILWYFTVSYNPNVPRYLYCAHKFPRAPLHAPRSWTKRPWIPKYQVPVLTAVGVLINSPSLLHFSIHFILLHLQHLLSTTTTSP